MDNRSIGVFDSGVGGLTVVKEIKKILPNESITYFGDTARVPYGTKSYETVKKYSFQNIRFLLEKNVKAIVIACNTATAISLDLVQKEFDVPIIGVIKSGVKASVSSTKNNKIGIIGTKATVNSGAYQREMKNYSNNISTYGIPCSLLVGVVEEGWFDNEIAYNVVKRYLKEFDGRNIDTLVLGCTHFPLLSKVIGNILGGSVTLINPAFETAKELKSVLEDNNLLNYDNKNVEHKYFLSDISSNFKNIACEFLGERELDLLNVDIEKFQGEKL